MKHLVTALFCFCFLNSLLANDTVNLTGKITLINTEEGLFYAIKVPKPVTKTVEGETLTTDVLQLVILDYQLYEKMDSLINKTVTLQGRLMERHTVHHHTPILFLIEKPQ